MKWIGWSGFSNGKLKGGDGMPSMRRDLKAIDVMPGSNNLVAEICRFCKTLIQQGDCRHCQWLIRYPPLLPCCINKKNFITHFVRSNISSGLNEVLPLTD